MASVYGLELTRGDEYDFGNVFEFPEKATQTFIKYDPVKLTTSGTVEDALVSESHFGIALADASGTTNALVPVLLLNREMYFVASQSNAGATQVTAQTMVGLQCGWIKSTITDHTTKITIDTNNTSNLIFEIVALDPRDAVGAADGRVIVRVVPDQISAR
jgi:hypothetical protein